MPLLGLDVADGRITGVVVGPDGAVVRRAQRASAEARLQDLVDQLAADLTIEALGVAIDAEPDAAVVVALERPGALPAPHRCTPGAAAIVAENWVGAARGSRHAVVLKIGERVFAGILLDGRYWAGAHGLAGSAAWLALNPVERQDYRKFGSLAAEVSNKGIARRLSWRIQAGDSSAVLERAGDLESITAMHVFDGARSGDGVSISVVRDTAKYIGMAVANLASCLDPEIVVLSGEVAAAGDLLLEPVRQECARRLPPGMVEQVRLEISPLGEDGVAIGAARLAGLARA
jgi:predicted NBD/HSP70 family sugar kinase